MRNCMRLQSVSTETLSVILLVGAKIPWLDRTSMENWLIHWPEKKPLKRCVLKQPHHNTCRHLPPLSRSSSKADTFVVVHRRLLLAAFVQDQPYLCRQSNCTVNITSHQSLGHTEKQLKTYFLTRLLYLLYFFLWREWVGEWVSRV